MASTTEPSPPRTIESCLLTRHNATLESTPLDFMEPYTGPGTFAKYIYAWKGYTIRSQQVELCDYAVSTSLNAYVTQSVFLLVDEDIDSRRITPMRYRDMMVDNYLAAGGCLRTWKFIGTQSIINDDTRQLAWECLFKAQNIVGMPGLQEFSPNDKGYSAALYGNPFTRGIQHMLHKYQRQTGNAKIKKFTFISPCRKPGDADAYPRLHLVVELCRPGEDGYPS
ncbi:hypothetical protein F4777DRAFT_598756 [Nemania sp. FL0916]|nr:hypothetical protein F4777DRAFT_598756 [Nemania sp. FL0916]